MAKIQSMKYPRNIHVHSQSPGVQMCRQAVIRNISSDTPLRITRSRTDDGPEQLAIVGLGMVLNPVHIPSGDAEHIPGGEEETLGGFG
mmetsp:Transcript_30385/g.67364  ORF Transcript_30385/g.67364 Transcript_30385/m.67364 type:complete len:88 (-) Transcript_30385:49-312(-)